MKKGKRPEFFLILILLTVCLVVTKPLLAADTSDQARQQELRTLKQEVVKLQYAEAETVRKLLVPYFGPDTRVSADDKTNFLTLSDNPENLEKMLEVIRKIDVKPRDMVFSLQLIIASESAGTIDAELKNDPLIKELQKLLRFKGYEILDTTMVRAMDRKQSMISFGPNNQFDITLRPEIASDPPPGSIKLNIFLRQVKAETTLPSGEKVWNPINPLYLIDSNLSLKSGDRTVVGISRLTEGATSVNHKGLILIISGKIVN